MAENATGTTTSAYHRQQVAPTSTMAVDSNGRVVQDVWWHLYDLDWTSAYDCDFRSTDRDRSHGEEIQHL